MMELSIHEQPDFKGLVFNIERFCVHDGPGIRTLVFLKGCPLSCRWCANPEGLEIEPQVVFFPERCIACGQCVEVCRHGAAIRAPDGLISVAAERCSHCGECVAVCPARARLLYGKKMSVVEVFEEVYKDLPFYRRSRGGITLSGGEPLAQADFTRCLLQYCSRQNVHTAVETSGYARWDTLSWAFEFADLILFDFKHFNPLKHLKFTGVNNHQIIGNLKRLDAKGVPLIIRVPVVPGFNATVDEMRGMADFIAGLENPHPCYLLPYHAMAKPKYRLFGIEKCFHQTDSPSSELMRDFFEIWLRRGLDTQIGG